MGELTATGVKALAKVPGRHGDGDGLFLMVRDTGTAAWMVRVQKDGRRRDIGLGSLSKVGLAKARELAGKTRADVAAGIDPVAERKKAKGIPTSGKLRPRFTLNTSAVGKTENTKTNGSTRWRALSDVMHRSVTGCGRAD